MAITSLNYDLTSRLKNLLMRWLTADDCRRIIYHADQDAKPLISLCRKLLRHRYPVLVQAILVIILLEPLRAQAPHQRWLSFFHTLLESLKSLWIVPGQTSLQRWVSFLDDETDLIPLKDVEEMACCYYDLFDNAEPPMPSVMTFLDDLIGDIPIPSTEPCCNGGEGRCSNPRQCYHEIRLHVASRQNDGVR